MAKAKKKTPKKKPKARKKRGPKPGCKSPATSTGRKKAGRSSKKHAAQMSTKGLSDKREAFIRQYMIHLNGAKAAREAGYSERTADSIAAQLLRDTQVRKRLAVEMNARNRRLEATADRVLQELVSVAFANFDDVATRKGGKITLRNAGKWERMESAALKFEARLDAKGRVLSMKVGQHSKSRALELLMRHMGMLDPTGRQDTKGTIVEFMERLKNGKGVE
jgi:phage terminase small subunit